MWHRRCQRCRTLAAVHTALSTGAPSPVESAAGGEPAALLLDPSEDDRSEDRFPLRFSEADVLPLVVVSEEHDGAGEVVP